MVENAVNVIAERQALATVNEWLVCHVGDRFLAGTPALDSAADLWRVSILYVYPNEGPLGSVGEAVIDSLTGELQTHPPIDEIKRRALELYRAKRGTDPTPVLSSRD